MLFSIFMLLEIELGYYHKQEKKIYNRYMELWQSIVVAIYGISSFIGTIKGLRECISKKNPYGIAYPYHVIGAFVWGDAVIFGFFWTGFAITSLLLNDWLLFLLALSLFWVVRSLGESIYWLNQQFSPINRNPPEKLLFHKVFPSDSIWFIYQVFWQCATVTFLLLSLYVGSLWLHSRPY